MSNTKVGGDKLRMANTRGSDNHNERLYLIYYKVLFIEKNYPAIFSDKNLTLAIPSIHLSNIKCYVHLHYSFV